MPVHRFTVAVPNPAAGSATATLTLEPIPVSELQGHGYSVSSPDLKIRAARITPSVGSTSLLGCAGAIWMAVRSIEQLVRRLLGLPPALRPLRLELESGGSADVEVVVDVPAGAGAAAVHLVDRRDGKVVGGVTLVVGGGIDQPPSTTIEAERPCPIDLAEDPYWLPPGAEPDEPGFGGFAPTGSEMQLVAWIKNPTQVTLEGVTAYLEHLGGSSARFAPVTWNLGTLEPGARFPLTWSIRSGAHATGRWSASVVVAAAGLEPTRIPVAIAFAGDAVEGYEPEELTDPS